MTLKAFAGFPVAAAKAVYNLRSIHLSQWWDGLTASWGSLDDYAAVAKKGQRNAYINRALRILSQMIASIDLVLYVDDEQVDDNGVLALIRRPNPRQTRRHFWDNILNCLFFGGEYWIERRAPETGANAGKPKRIYIWSPQYFSDFIKNNERAPDGFYDSLSPETRRMVGPDDIIGYEMVHPETAEAVRFTIEEMHHARTYNPLNEDRGLPIIIGAYRAVETIEASEDWNKSIASGGGRVPGWWRPTNLSEGQTLSPEQVESAQQAFDDHMKERQKVNLGMVLSGAYEWVDNAINPKDAEWLEGLKHNLRMVACVTGVSATLLGDEKGGSLTDAGVDSEVRATMIMTALPLVDFVLEEFNVWLAPLFGEAKVGYDKGKIEALQEDEDKKYARLLRACGGPFITRDEARVGVSKETLGGEYDEVLDPGFASTPSQRGVPVGGDGAAASFPKNVQNLIELVVGDGK